MFDPIKALFASSFSKNGINELADFSVTLPPNTHYYDDFSAPIF